MSFQHEHEKLWRWLADRPEKTKQDYFSCIPEERRPLYLCYACVEAVRRAEVDHPIVCIAQMRHCDYCPIDWLAEAIDITDYDRLCPCCAAASPYMKVAYVKGAKEPGYEAAVKTLCETIAALPWRQPHRKEMETPHEPESIL